ncbi:MAG: HD domain-containing protein, partial [Planctomycetes bacterium]|nr:HD domain-containing protein [Planctomycetota bacterium]
QSLLPIGVVTLFWTVALLSITVYLILMRQRQALDRERARSSSDILRQTQMLIRTRDALVFALAKLAGFRDDETGQHLERISAYSVQLASALRHHPKYSQQVTPAFVRLIGLGSILHDIGKVGIEDSILRKPGKFTHEERQRMQLHTSIAGDCLGEIAQSLGSSNFLEMAREVALAHHEHWDGTGYPNGLEGDAIPLSARIVAIADVYDALATRRVYKDVVSHEQCVAIIRDAAGSQFDPDLVDIWLTIEEEFRKIASQYADPPVRSERGRSRATGLDTQQDQQRIRTQGSAVAEDEHLKVST